MIDTITINSFILTSWGGQIRHFMHELKQQPPSNTALIIVSDSRFLPRDAAQSAVLPWQVVRPSVVCL